MSIFTSVIGGSKHQLGPMTVERVMPQQALTPVGAFVFLDYFDNSVKPEDIPKPDGRGAHPHRGIATLTYLMNGEITHIDSFGHQGTVQNGGVQWMKAGNGIVHDEWGKPVNNRIVGMQFWLNLSAKEKAEKPDYKAFAHEQLPVFDIGTLGSTLKVIIGAFQNQSSPLRVEGSQRLYHIHLKANEQITLDLNPDEQYAAFLASGQIDVFGETLTAKRQGYIQAGTATLEITAQEESELMVYGGEMYREPIVSGGPFIMNTEEELVAAYRDYQAGKYGVIDYDAYGN